MSNASVACTVPVPVRTAASTSPGDSLVGVSMFALFGQKLQPAGSQCVLWVVSVPNKGKGGRRGWMATRYIRKENKGSSDKPPSKISRNLMLLQRVLSS